MIVSAIADPGYTDSYALKNSVSFALGPSFNGRLGREFVVVPGTPKVLRQMVGAYNDLSVTVAEEPWQAFEESKDPEKKLLIFATRAGLSPLVMEGFINRAVQCGVKVEVYTQ